MLHMKKCDSEQETAYRGCVLTIEGKKKIQPYKEQRLLLREYRSFSLWNPKKDSQEEFEQAAFYFANGRV